MRKRYRVVLIGTALLSALALAAPALAGYAPRLAVSSQGQALGAQGVNIKFIQAGNDDPTGKLSVLVPKGYSVSTGSAGTKIGAVSATVIAPDLKRTVKTNGTLVVANSTDFPTESQTCTGATSHAAVWSFTLSVASTSFRIPVFVDTSVSGPGAQFASASLTMCFAAGDTPSGTPGRAALGAKIVNLLISTKAISSPKDNGTFRWRASATPYTAGTGAANLKAIVEVQSLVPLPLELTLTAKVAPSRSGFSNVSLAGAFKAAGQGIPGIFVVLQRGSTARNLKQIGVLSTHPEGAFGSKGDVPQSGAAQHVFFRVTTTAIEKDLGLAGCQPTTPAVPCIDTTLPYNVTSRVVQITIPGKH